MVHRRVLGLSNHGATLATILTHASALVRGTKNGKLDPLKTHQPLTDIIIGRWVNGAALGISEELV